MKKISFRSNNDQSKRLTDGRYAYFPADGAPIILVPGVDVSEDVIIMLQEMDDEVARRDRVEEDHRFNLEHSRAKQVDNSNSQATEPMEELPDTASDIFAQLFPDAAVEDEAIRILEECMEMLTPQQQDYIRERFGMQLGVYEIADRDGVSHQAINNRQNKIFKRLKKLMAERGIE